jgi:electron-transferring-flavoprotein dehydrogenase
MLRRQFQRAFCTARDQMEFDLVIVGAGPSGLSCAIRAKQLSPDLNVCVVEKGSDVGSHILSGNIFEPRALNELIPSWKDKQAPLRVPVTHDEFFVLPSRSRKLSLPHMLFPKELDNTGNYIISLGELCKWLSSEAEAAGVEVFSGFAVAEPIFDSTNRVIGVQTRDTGIAKDKSHKSSYTPGIDLLAKQVILAEGARGSLTEKLIDHYNLRRDSCPPTYSLGLKEVWEIDPKKHKPGSVFHAVGYPIRDLSTYGGSFLYHMDNNIVHLGLVIGLDYRNPYLNTYQTFQDFKRHAWVSELLSGGKCLSYGARVLNVGGYQALPKLSFPGGLIVGCSAGFLNLPKIKGTHTAMKSGMIAAEVATEAISRNAHTGELTDYESAIKSSWIGEELYRVRNMKPAFKLGGMLGGLAYGGSMLKFLKGKEPWTLRWKTKDYEKTLPADKATELEYEKPDGKLTFDILENLARSGVKHEHDQPSHLRVKPELRNVAEHESWEVFRGPESRFCPAKVYEFSEEDGKLTINAQNCVHCKSCSIKTPREYIEWTVPEGGGGPQYSSM